MTDAQAKRYWFRFRRNRRFKEDSVFVGIMAMACLNPGFFGVGFIGMLEGKYWLIPVAIVCFVANSLTLMKIINRLYPRLR